MSQSPKEFFFIIYFKNKTKPKDEIKFKSKENNPECILTKKIESNEVYVECIKIFKYLGEPKKEESFEFSFDNEDFKVTLKNLKEQTFIFDINLNQQKSKWKKKLFIKNY